MMAGIVKTKGTLGSYSRQLMQALGLDVPVYPVKGYSLTVPVINSAAAPISTVMDETYKVGRVAQAKCWPV